MVKMGSSYRFALASVRSTIMSSEACKLASFLPAPLSTRTFALVFTKMMMLEWLSSRVPRSSYLSF